MRQALGGRLAPEIPMFLFTTPQTSEAPASRQSGRQRHSRGRGEDRCRVRLPAEDGAAGIGAGARRQGEDLERDRPVPVHRADLALDGEAGGAKAGALGLCHAISEERYGRLTVSDPAGARKDPAAAQRSAGRRRDGRGADAEEPRPADLRSLGRQPHAGELYMAHVLGARGASDLIQAAASDPTRAAPRIFPMRPQPIAASSSTNRAGRARRRRSMACCPPATPARSWRRRRTASTGASRQSERGRASTSPPRSPPRCARARQGADRLFSTEGSREPVSKAVANLWTTPRTGRHAGWLGSIRPIVISRARHRMTPARRHPLCPFRRSGADAAASCQRSHAPVAAGRPDPAGEPPKPSPWPRPGARRSTCPPS
jgi:hypothetical protein